MIAAANADGQIDGMEQQQIREQLTRLNLGDEATRLLSAEISRPIDVRTLAGQVDSPATASEVYLLSSLIIDDTSPTELAYLDGLAAALKLPSDLIAQLQKSAAAA